MAIWQTSQILGIDIGNAPNDGTGDSIRNAFNAVDTNFSNISTFLSTSYTSVDYVLANVTTANVSVLNNTTANIITLTGNNATFRANVTTGNVIANSKIYSSGMVITGNIVPTTSGTFDLGSAANPFGTIYYTSLAAGGTAQSTDAGQLVVHANTTPGDVKDVGILGNVSHHYSSNTYAFFGYQYQTDNFIYKLTNTDPTRGNAVVYDGIYGNTHFGSQYLSNTTTSTSTTSGALIVAGGVGIAGRLYAGANVTVSGNIIAANLIYSNGSPVLTNTSSGIGVLYSSGSIFTVPVSVTDSTISTSTLTGAVLVNGGVGVIGNINAGRLYGPYYGTVQTAAQPNITSLGTLSSLTMGGTLSYTQLSGQGILATANVVLQGSEGAWVTGGNIRATVGVVGTLYGSVYGIVQTAAQPQITSVGTLTGLTVTGNTTSSNVTAQLTVSGTTGSFTNLSGTLYTTAQNNITSVGTLTTLTVSGATQTAAITSSGTIIAATVNAATIGNASAVLTGTLSTAAQTNITSVGTLTTVTVSGNTIVNSTVYGRGVYDNGTRVVSTSSGAGNLSISGTAINLNTIGPGAVTTGSATAVPIITTDVYGRITGISTASVSSTLTTTGTSGTGSIALVSQGITFAGTYGVTAVASSQTITISTPQDLQTSASPVFASPRLTGTLAAAAVNAATIGNASAVLYGTLNSSSAAQTNITSVGTLSSLTVSGQITVNSGNNTTAIVNGGTNGVGNIGSSTTGFNTVFAKATTAQYADLAEKYLADQDYSIGTVVAVGGDAEVTASSFGDLAIGVVSEKPAYMMNSELEGGTYIALKGRVPVWVIGSVRKGQRLIASDSGRAVAGVQNSSNVFAIALESNDDSGAKLIEAVIL